MQITFGSSFAGKSERPADNIAGMLLAAARQHGSCGVLVVADEPSLDAEFISYSALLEEAQHILGGLQACGRPPGAKVVLLLERPKDFIPTFWACVLGGYVPCPVVPIRNDPDRWAKHLAYIDTLLDSPLVISAARLLNEVPAFFASTDVSDLRRAPQREYVHPAEVSDAAVMMLTSGSTGNSKAVELSHKNLLASMEARAERQQLTSADITFNWIAFDHVAALLESHMIALHVGATQLHALPAGILADPLQFVRIINRHRVSIAFAPNFLLGQINAALPSLEDSEPSAVELDLSCLRRVVTGGEANVVETGRRFLELLAPHGLRRNALWPAWGMTETCAASIYSHEFPDIDANREFAAIGLPIRGLDVRIVDDHGRTSAAGEAGELQVRGPMVFRRYHNNEEATRAAFTSDGWFRTGDVGRVEEGRLCLVARNKDSIIVSGVNYYSQELETKLEQLEGIEHSFIAAFPTRPRGADTERLVITFATTLLSEQEEELYQLLVAIRNTTILLWGFRPAVILPLPKGAFPKTSLGKIQRSLMRNRFEAGDYATHINEVGRITSRQAGPHVAPDGPYERAVAEVFSQILCMGLDAVSANASFFDLGGTSLDIMKLTRALERRFGAKVGLPVVLQNPSVRHLAQYRTSGAPMSVREYDPIVPLQVTGRKVPLFCVHPGNGEIFVLTNVAKYFLNDRPFYALRPRGFDDGEDCFHILEEMVDSYVSAILRRQPGGPYAIAGYSLGCQIAFEVARELERRGHRVGFLGSIDHWPSWELTQLGFNMATGLALVIDLISLDQYERLNQELHPQLPSDEVCDYVLRFASSERLAELDLDRQRFATWARVAHSVETLLFKHVNSGSVENMTIFCSEGISARYVRTQWARQTWRAELERWSARVKHPKYVDVPGDHHALMGPKHVAVFQSRLRNELDLALGGL